MIGVDIEVKPSARLGATAPEFLRARAATSSHLDNLRAYESAPHRHVTVRSPAERREQETDVAWRDCQAPTGMLCDDLARSLRPAVRCPLVKVGKRSRVR